MMTFAGFYNFLTYISIFSVGIPITISLLRLNKLDKAARALLLFLAICGASDVLCLIYRNSVTVLNVLLNIFTIFEALIVFYIYRLELTWKTIINFAIISFCLVSVWQFGFVALLASEDNVVSTYEALLVIILSGVYFHKLLGDDRVKRPGRFHFFWINLAFLFYFGTSLLLFATNDFINQAPTKIASALWSLYLVINITCNILFALGTWRIRKYSHL